MSAVQFKQKYNDVLFEFDFTPVHGYIYGIRVKLHGMMKRTKRPVLTSQTINLTTFRHGNIDHLYDKLMHRVTIKNITKIEVLYKSKTRG